MFLLEVKISYIYAIASEIFTEIYSLGGFFWWLNHSLE